MANPYNAPDFRGGGLSISGDIEVDAFSSVARFAGVAPGTFSPNGFPEHTFFGNITSAAASATHWSWPNFLGGGLSYNVAITVAAAKFPEVIESYTVSDATAGTSVDITLPASRAIGDRILIHVHCAAGAVVQDINVPTDWSSVAENNFALNGGSIVLERIVDGTETSPLTVTYTQSGAALARVFLIRNSDATQASTAASATVGGTATTITPAAIFPNFGEANTLWLALIDIESDNAAGDQITVFPTGFINTGQDELTSGSGSLDATIGYGQRTERAISLAPSAWTWTTAGRANAIMVAVPPKRVGQLDLAVQNVAADTLRGNLFDFSAVERPWSVSDLAGNGLGYVTAIANGPFPSVSLAYTVKSATAAATPVTSHVVPMPKLEPGQCVLLAVASSNAGSITTPTERAWVSLGTLSATGSRLTLYWLSVDSVAAAVEGPTPIVFAAGNGIVARVNVIEDAHPSVNPSLAFTAQTSSGATTNDPPNLTPASGIANYLWFSFLATQLEDNIVSAFPTSYTNTGQDFLTGTSSEDTSLAYCQRLLRATSENPAAYTYANGGSGQSVSATVAIVPRTVGKMHVVPGAGGSMVVSETDLQRGALTGAITAAQDSNVTAFGAAAAKSVLANATNASAVPAFLAGSAAFQHLRVNSANTALEWATLSSGDFGAGIVPLTAIATQAANTIVANATGSTASPTAVAVAADSVLARVGGNLVSHPWSTLFGTGFSYSAGVATWAGVTIRKNTGADVGTRRRINLIEGTNVTLTIADDSVDGELDVTVAATAAHTIRDNGVAETQRAALNLLSTTSIVLAAADDAVNNETEVTAERAALTGAITAAQNSNTTAFGAAAAKSVLANATNGSAVPAFLAGTAAFQYLRVNSANTALEWATLSGHASTSITYTSDQFQRAALTGAISAAANANSTLFAGIRLNNVAQTARANINLVSSATITPSVSDDAGNNEQEWSFSIASDAVDNTAAANMPANTVKVNNTASSGDPVDMSVGTNTVVGRVAGNIVAGQVVTSQVADDQITDSKLRNSLALSVLGRSANSTGDPADIQAGANDRLLRRVSDVLDFGVLTAGMVPANVISNTMIRDGAARTLIGNPTDATADPQDVDQVELMRIESLPTAGGDRVVLWEDENFNVGVDPNSSGTTTPGDIFEGATGHGSHWFIGASAGTANANRLASTVGSIGVFQAVTGATTNDDAIVFMGLSPGGGTGTTLTDTVIDFEHIKSIDWFVETISSANRFTRIGCGSSVAGTGMGNESAYFQHDPNVNGNWHIVTRLAGTSNSQDTGVPHVAGKHIFTIVRTSASQVDFYLDEVLIGSSTSQIPTGTVTPGVRLITLTAGTKTINIDRCRIYARTAAYL